MGIGDLGLGPIPNPKFKKKSDKKININLIYI